MLLPSLVASQQLQLQLQLQQLQQQQHHNESVIFAAPTNGAALLPSLTINGAIDSAASNATLTSSAANVSSSSAAAVAEEDNQFLVSVQMQVFMYVVYGALAASAIASNAVVCRIILANSARAAFPAAFRATIASTAANTTAAATNCSQCSCCSYAAASNNVVSNCVKNSSTITTSGAVANASVSSNVAAAAAAAANTVAVTPAPMQQQQQQQRNKRSATNYFIVNLAVGDILMALLCIPFTFVSNLIYGYWPFGLPLCIAVSFSQAVSVFVSVYTMVAMSIDKYIAIIHPLRPRMSGATAKTIICAIWFAACATSLPTVLLTQLKPASFYQSNNENLICQEIWPPVWPNARYYYSMALMVLQFVLPFLILVVTYARIVAVIWFNKTPGEQLTACNAREAQQARSKRKMVKMVMFCVIAFALTWLPFNALIVVGDYYHSIWSLPQINYVWFVTHYLAMCHTVTNPLIYVWTSKRFRAGFRQVGVEMWLRALAAVALVARHCCCWCGAMRAQRAFERNRHKYLHRHCPSLQPVAAAAAAHCPRQHHHSYSHSHHHNSKAVTLTVTPAAHLASHKLAPQTSAACRLSAANGKTSDSPISGDDATQATLATQPPPPTRC